jgi:hypothetical protein
MAEIAKETDLTKLEGDPTPRAHVRLQLEKFEVEVKLPGWLGGGYVKVSSETRSGSLLATAIVTLVLMVAGGVPAAIVFGVGGPAWAVIVAGLCLPSAICMLLLRVGGGPS